VPCGVVDDHARRPPRRNAGEKTPDEPRLRGTVRRPFCLSARELPIPTRDNGPQRPSPFSGRVAAARAERLGRRRQPPAAALRPPHVAPSDGAVSCKGGEERRFSSQSGDRLPPSKGPNRATSTSARCHGIRMRAGPTRLHAYTLLHTTRHRVPHVSKISKVSRTQMPSRAKRTQRTLSASNKQLPKHLMRTHSK
jgi:hypothetical protein